MTNTQPLSEVEPIDYFAQEDESIPDDFPSQDDDGKIDLDTSSVKSTVEQ